MLKLNNDYITKTYEYEGGFLVDVTTNNLSRYYDVFLYHESIGIKEHMFGLSMDNFTIPELLDIVDANLRSENYIPGYIAEFMCEDNFEETDE